VLDTKKLYTERELAEDLAQSVSQIRRWRRLHGLPFVRIGRSIKYRNETVERWLEERENHTTGIDRGLRLANPMKEVR
jgi:excisionase family DNA binding protein